VASPSSPPAATASSWWCGTTRGDGDLNGIFAKRFGSLDIFGIDGNGAVDPLTDGLLALRFLFGFTGSTLTSGAVGGGCTRCSAATIEAYLSTLI
jgi:hypothetical protein